VRHAASAALRSANESGQYPLTNVMKIICD
jgi:hypothetical protein